MVPTSIRFFCRRLPNIQHFRTLYTSSSLQISASPLKRTTDDCESYDEKNMRLNRPMSPHLSIYKPQLTSMMSISHRITGMVLAGYAMSAAFATLVVCDGVPRILDNISDWCLPLPLIFAAKVLFAFPATYHYFNGIRHLAWDIGKFLTIKGVYRTGYTVLILATISAVVLALL